MISLFMPPILNVAGADTDTDVPYGADVAAEHNAFKNNRYRNFATHQKAQNC